MSLITIVIGKKSHELDTCQRMAAQEKWRTRLAGNFEPTPGGAHPGIPSYDEPDRCTGLSVGGLTTDTPALRGLVPTVTPWDDGSYALFTSGRALKKAFAFLSLLTISFHSSSTFLDAIPYIPLEKTDELRTISDTLRTTTSPNVPALHS
jgi:hypothetical protein